MPRCWWWAAPALSVPIWWNGCLRDGSAKICIVDNLLSSQIENVPDHPAVEFVYGSIAEDRILEGLDRGFDYAFHLACFHGNQSSIADPIADHDNNTITSLSSSIG